MKDKENKKRVSDAGNMLLDVGVALVSSGASTHRTRLTLERMAAGLGFKIELLITQRALMVTVLDENKEQYISRLKRTSPHGVNYKTVSGISRLSWRVYEENWTVDQVMVELRRLKKLPHYPRILILTTVGIAGSAFCYIFGGGFIDMVVAFIATFVGLFVRQTATNVKFNPYMSVYFASLSASLIAGFAEYLSIGTNPAAAFSTSVLFLIPGVPFINAVTDIMDGNTQNGIVRLVNGLVISFCIAMGIFTVRTLLNF